MRLTFVSVTLTLWGCQAGMVAGGDFPPPTVDTVPKQTAEPLLHLEGGQLLGAAVWVQLAHEANARGATTKGDGTRWEIDLPLSMGNNRFVVFATDLTETRFSPQTGPFNVELVSNVAIPTLDPVISPTSVPVQTLTGTKGAGTSLHLTMGGTEVQIVPAGNDTTWSYDLTLQEGTNDFSIRARDPNEPQPSPNITASIVLDTTPPEAPVLTNGDSATADDTVTLTGTRAADGNLCLRREQEPYCLEVIPLDGGTTIDLDVPLGNGGNYLCLSSVDELGNASAEVCITVTKVPGPVISFVVPDNGQAILASDVDVVAEIISSPSPLDTSSILVCVNDDDCQPMTSAGGNHFERNIDLSGLTSGINHSISVSASNDAGVTTTATISILYSAGVAMLSTHSAPGHSTSPAMVMSAGTLHVAWADECSQYDQDCDVPGAAGNLPLDIFYRSFTSSGWGPTEVVSDGGGQQSADGDSRAPGIAVGTTGDVHVVWSERGNVLGSGADSDIVHRVRSADSGTFGTTIVVTNNAVDDTSPVIAAGQNGSVHLAWVRSSGSDRDIYYSRFTPGGGWSSEVLVSDDPDDGLDSALPAIAVDASDDAHIVWQDNGAIQSSGTDLDIFYRKVSGGVPGPIVLVTDNGQDNTLSSESRAAAVAVQGSTVAIAWEESANILSSGTDVDIFLRLYDTNQAPQSASGQYTLVSYNSSVASTSVALAFNSSGDVVATWAEGSSPNTEIVFNTAQSGYFFNSTTAWSDASPLRANPTIALDDADNIHLVWEDTSTPPGFTEDDPRPDSSPDIDLLYTVSPSSP